MRQQAVCLLRALAENIVFDFNRSTMGAVYALSFPVSQSSGAVLGIVSVPIFDSRGDSIFDWLRTATESQ
jgi:hypothetical protein